MTSESILNKKFDRATVGGYRTDDVDAYMVSMAECFDELAEERIDLQNKLVILAEKLEEYRSDEESMRSALLGAQKLGDKIVKDSQDKASVIVEDAVQEAEAITSTAKERARKLSQEVDSQLETKTMALNRMKREVDQFQKKVLAMYQQHIDLLNSLPREGSKSISSLPDPLTSKMSSSAGKENRDSGKQSQKMAASPKNEEIKPTPKEGEFKPLEFGEGFQVTHQSEEKSQ